MLLNRDHPAFNPTMEFLCLLAKEPITATLAQVRADLGLDRQKDVQILIDEARELGVRVKVFQKPGQGNCAAIASKSWEKASEFATQYFDAVYPV